MAVVARGGRRLVAHVRDHRGGAAAERAHRDEPEDDREAALDRLYDYMQRRLLEANLRNDPAIIDEVSGLLKTVKSAWDEIGSVAPA